MTYHADDTYISLEHRNVNFGKLTDLVVSSKHERTLLRFNDLRYSILQLREQRVEILEAKIQLFIRGAVTKDDGWEDPVLALHNVDGNFCEDEATWDCRDMDESDHCSSWKMTPLPPKIHPDYKFEPTDVVNISTYQHGYIEFNVTHDITDFIYSTPEHTKSYLLKKACESDPGRIVFWSCENEGDDGEHCPILWVRVRNACFPPPKPVEPPVTCEEDEIEETRSTKLRRARK